MNMNRRLEALEERAARRRAETQSRRCDVIRGDAEGMLLAEVYSRLHHGGPLPDTIPERLRGLTLQQAGRMLNERMDYLAALRGVR